MVLHHVLCAAGGVALASVVGSLGKRGAVHTGAVKVAAAGMRVADKVTRVTRSIVDEAEDINAEARRQARIDAAVAERLAEVEEGIRAEVTAQVDGAAQEA